MQPMAVRDQEFPSQDDLKKLVVNPPTETPCYHFKQVVLNELWACLEVKSHYLR
jgi:hypothetical protein